MVILINFFDESIICRNATYIKGFYCDERVEHGIFKNMSDRDFKNKQILNQSDYELLSEFRYTVRKFLKFSEDAAEKAGLTPNQHQALLTIKGSPNHAKMTNGELAERLQIKHHSAVGLVNRLAAQKLVFREQSGGDRREVYISLTKSGETLLEKLSVVHRAELKSLAPHLKKLMSEVGKYTR